MKCSRSLLVCLALFFLAPIVQAETSTKQERVNLTVGVSTFSQAAADLREVTDQFEVEIQNLNLHQGNSSGSVTLRVQPDQLSAVVEELSVLGQVQSQSQNTNDFASSLNQYNRRLKAFQAIQKLKLSKQFEQLPDGQREVAQSEFQSWVNNQINNAENNLKNYREQAKYAEVYLNFTLLQMEEPVEQSDDSQADAAVKTNDSEKPKQESHGPSPEFFFLCLINMAGLWLIYRKVDRNVVGLND